MQGGFNTIISTDRLVDKFEKPNSNFLSVFIYRKTRIIAFKSLSVCILGVRGTHEIALIYSVCYLRFALGLV